MKSIGQAYQLKDVGVRGRFLTFRPAVNGVPLKSPLPIPFGSVSSTSGHTFTVKVSNGRVSQLIASTKDRVTSTDVQILPPYSWRGSASLNGFGKVVLEVWQVISDVDRMRAMQIINRSHYLSAPSSGLIVGCRFADEAVQKRVRAAIKGQAKRDSWSDAWHEKPGGMVACAVLDTLFHGNPRGRRIIAEDEKATDLLKGKWHKKNRAEVVDRLKVLWGSRFAVDSPYRGLGLGTLLAKRLVDISLKHRVPAAKYIEVITTLPTERAKALLESGAKHDFLVEAGYTRVPELLSSKPLLRADPETGERLEFISAKKLYYFIRVE